MEIVLLLVVALLLFGAKRLPEIGRSLGTGMREFKDSVTGETKKDENLTRSELPPPAKTVPINLNVPVTMNQACSVPIFTASREPTGVLRASSARALY